MSTSSQLCERARAWTSLRVDSELSELEAALLDAHLGRCDACRAFARDAESVASALRSVRPEPAPVILDLPARGRTSRRTAQVAAALVVAVAAGLGAALLGTPAARPVAKPVAMVAGGDSADGLRLLRRPALVAQGRSTGARHRKDVGSV